MKELAPANDDLDPSGPPQGILLVDDDDRVLKFVSRMLYSFGYDQIYQAASAQEAYGIWEKHKPKVWLLITDFVMPQITGDVMALKLLEGRPDLKVLFISGNDPDSLGSQIPLRSGRNFLQKPFTFVDLRQTVQGIRAPMASAV